MRSDPPTFISARTCAHEAALQAEAARLAPLLRRGDCLRLEGNLGAGKTSFARALIRTLTGRDVEVASPTFTLVQQYPILLHGEAAMVSHADFYRIENESELDEIGVSDLLMGGLMLVEWPGIAADWLPQAALSLRISHGEESQQRRLD